MGRRAEDTLAGEQGEQGEARHFAFPVGHMPSNLPAGSSAGPHFEIPPSCETFTNGVFWTNYSCHKNAQINFFKDCHTESGC